jgi:putative glycosyltransferase (TIGR04372 family)
MNSVRGQWEQVRAGGWPVFRKKVHAAVRLFFRLQGWVINGIWAIPAVLAIRILRPVMYVRMSQLNSRRVGHFIEDASLHLAQHSLDLKKERIVDLFWFERPTANAQWERMVTRRLPTKWWVRYLVAVNKFIPGGARNASPFPNGCRDIHGVLQRTPDRFEFLAEEEAAAKGWLRDRGWNDGEPFVCLLVRDSVYLASHPLHAGNDPQRWTYHNYRDSDITTYQDAVRALVDKGYWVIRMGKAVRKRLAVTHPRVIDYPFVPDQNDLMDIWLSANCHFFITTGSGIDTVAAVYHRPLVFVNYNPFGNLWSFTHSISVPKHLRWKDSGRMLTLKEHLRHGYSRSEDYDYAGVVLEDLSAGEITAAVMECEQRIAGTWVESVDDGERQRRFWQILRDWPEFSRFHDYVHPEARIGAEWLRMVGEELLAG